jgi:hypothetical protein
MIATGEVKYHSVVVSYENPICNADGDDISYERFALNPPVWEQDAIELSYGLADLGVVGLSTTEGLLFIRAANVVSLLFEEDI